MKYLTVFLFALFMCFCMHAHAQIYRYYYYGTKHTYSMERWNRHHRCHFKVYYDDGRLMAEGYKRNDKYRRHELPDSTFTVWTPDGHVIQKMTMTKDSISVVTLDSNAVLRGQIWAGRHHFREEEYLSNSDTAYIRECRMPDSIDYFTDYIHYPKEWIAMNKNNRWPEPRFPIGFGEAGNDGVSAAGTFKIYSRAAIIITGVYTGDCKTTIFKDGKRMR